MKRHFPQKCDVSQMFSLLDNSAAGFSLEMEIRIYQDENLYMYLHTRLQKLRKRKSIIVHMKQGRRNRAGWGRRGGITSLDFGKNVNQIFTSHCQFSGFSFILLLVIFLVKKHFFDLLKKTLFKVSIKNPNCFSWRQCSWKCI